MKIYCPDCKGKKKSKCQHCGGDSLCPYCEGSGEIESCISAFIIPEKHKNREALLALKADEYKVREQHARLCGLNPKSASSYDAQLETALEVIDTKASSLL